MADKYLKQSGAFLQEVISEDGSTTPVSGEVVALDSNGKVAVNILPVGFAPDTASIIASENLSVGDFVNVWDDTGTPKVRKADSTDNTKRADGFVKTSVTSGNAALVFFETKNENITAASAGLKLFLGTAGGVTTTAPSTTGNITQALGFSFSTTEMTVEIQTPILVA